MTGCINCSTPMPAEHEFCTECGWPRKQPSPYGGEDKVLPVAPWTESPDRDSKGRALSYDADPRSGRAYIPGTQPGAIDKVPDYPGTAGPANRHAGEVLSGTGLAHGTSEMSGSPLAVALGAGRLLWTDGRELFDWDFASAKPTREQLPSPVEDLAVIGWRTYLRGPNGLFVHDGLAKNARPILQERVDAMAPFGINLIAATGNRVLTFGRDGKYTESTAPWPVVAFASEGTILAAFSDDGAIATWNGDAWHQVLPAQAGKFAQGWIVNGRPGVRVGRGAKGEVQYAPVVDGQLPPAALTVETDSPLSVVPGKAGWEAHRLIGFVGGTRPRAMVYDPGTPGNGATEKTLSISTLGPSLAVVKRAKDGTGAITFAIVDIASHRVVFEALREATTTLPTSHPLIALNQKTFLLPHRNGVVVLAHDGERAVVNIIPYPA